METPVPGYRMKAGAASLVIGPALMSIGDLLHPHESWDPAIQVAMLENSASRWYLAHLLLFIGFLLFVPGMLEITRLGAWRRPVAAYWARVLMLISVGALSAVFVFEMLLGSFLVRIGGDQQLGVALLQAFQSAEIFGALGPGLLAFFVGTAFFVRSLPPLTPSLRWPRWSFAAGALLILGEIVLAQVRLSQIGNILIFVAGVGFAQMLLREHVTSAA